MLLTFCWPYTYGRQALLAGVIEIQGRYHHSQTLSALQHQQLVLRAEAAQVSSKGAREDAATAAATSKEAATAAALEIAHLRQEHRQLQQQLTAHTSHLETVQQHTQQIRETARLQALELHASRHEYAEQTRDIETAQNRIRDLALQLQEVTTRLEYTQDDLSGERTGKCIYSC